MTLCKNFPFIHFENFILYQIISFYYQFATIDIMVLILDGSAEHGAHNGVNQVFRFVEGIWLHRKSRQIEFFYRIRPILLHVF